MILARTGGALPVYLGWNREAGRAGARPYDNIDVSRIAQDFSDAFRQLRQLFATQG